MIIDYESLTNDDISKEPDGRHHDENNSVITGSYERAPNDHDPWKHEESSAITSPMN